MVNDRSDGMEKGNDKTHRKSILSLNWININGRCNWTYIILIHHSYYIKIFKDCDAQIEFLRSRFLFSAS